MELEELKKTTLINLRSVTQSSKGGVPITVLDSDYKKLIGEPIPFRKLGYNSLENFIQDIPHVIKLKKNPNGLLLAEAVPDASTSHLTKLISKQKGSSSKSLKSSRVSKRYGFHKQNATITLKAATSQSCGSIDKELSNAKDQEIAFLKLKLKIEEDKNTALLSEVAKLNSLIDSGKKALSAEQEKVQQLQNQLEDLQKKMIFKYSDLNGVRWNENLEMQKKVDTLDWNDNLLYTNLTKTMTSQEGDKKQPISQLDCVSIHKQQSIQVSDLKNQVKQQNTSVTNLRKELQKQQLQINDLTVQVNKLSAEPPINEVDKEAIVKLLMKHVLQSPPFQELMSYASASSSNLNTNSNRNLCEVDQENVNMVRVAQAHVISEKPCDSAVSSSATSTSKRKQRKAKKKKINVIECIQSNKTT